MKNTSPLLTRLFSDRSGNVAITAGLTAPLFVGILALGVDYGYLTLQKRQLQQTADLAAQKHRNASGVGHDVHLPGLPRCRRMRKLRPTNPEVLMTAE